MMAKVLSQRHGFKCTVLFSLNDKGEIDPNNQKSLSNPEALDGADAIVMLLRFRTWPDEIYKHFDDAPSRHPDHRPAHQYARFSRQARRLRQARARRTMGEPLGRPQTRSLPRRHRARRGEGSHPQRRNNVFADSDVYEAYPPKDAKILMRGLVLENMKPDSKPSTRKKRNRQLNKVTGVNDPAMAVAWTRSHKWPSGKTSPIFTSTMGAATDLLSEGLRRMIVNAIYAGLKIEVPKKANVDYVDPYKPLFYGFNTFRKGLKPSDLHWGKCCRKPSNDLHPLPRRGDFHIAPFWNPIQARG